jgi:GNAT superfamily N-acetyltransferase
MTLQIRPEDPFSAVALTLIRDLSSDLAGRYSDDDDGGASQFQPAQVAVPRAAFVVAWRDDVAIGCGALRPMAEADTVEVKRMYVRPEARGQGISRRILAYLEQLAAEFGYKTVKLETGLLQPEAIGLYQSMGYLPLKCYGVYADDPLSVCFQKQIG